jgi:hypothetical protein
VVDYSYDPGDRVTQIKTTIGGTVYTMDYSYKANTDLTSQWLYKQGVTTLATDDFTYNALRLLTEEKVTSGGGSTLFHRKYGYDTMLRRTKVEDPVSGWQSLFAYDAASRMLRVTTSAGGGANPFPWPSGLTTVNTDRNGNILRMLNGTWWVAHEFDYEQRLTRVRASNGDVIENLMDAVGNRLKQLKTSGATTTETRFVYGAGCRVIQERDGTDAVTARYYWGLGKVLKKDNGANARYMVSDLMRSPMDAFDNAGAKVSTDVYDAYGVRIAGVSSGTRPHPFGWLSGYTLPSADELLLNTGAVVYPPLGAGVRGGFRLTHLGGAGCPEDNTACPEICGIFCVMAMPVMWDYPPSVFATIVKCPRDENCLPVALPMCCNPLYYFTTEEIPEALCVCRGIRAAWAYYGCGQGPGYDPKPLPFPEGMPCACRDLLENPPSDMGALLDGLISCCQSRAGGFAYRRPQRSRNSKCDCAQPNRGPCPTTAGGGYQLRIRMQGCSNEARQNLLAALGIICSRIGKGDCLSRNCNSEFRDCLCEICGGQRALCINCLPCAWGSGNPFTLLGCIGICQGGLLQDPNPGAAALESVACFLFHEIIHTCDRMLPIWQCARERRAYGCAEACFPGECTSDDRLVPACKKCRISKRDCVDPDCSLCPC